MLVMSTSKSRPASIGGSLSVSTTRRINYIISGCEPQLSRLVPSASNAACLAFLANTQGQWIMCWIVSTALSHKGHMSVVACFVVNFLGLVGAHLKINFTLVACRCHNRDLWNVPRASQSTK